LAVNRTTDAKVKKFLIASLIVSIAGSASAQRPVPPNASTPLRSTLTRDVIRDAVKQTLANGEKEDQQAPERVLNAQRYENFARQFADAQIPDCVHSKALKFQPTLFGGLLSAPFVVVAALRGKCR
jgi:hypothetical protein